MNSKSLLIESAAEIQDAYARYISDLPERVLGALEAERSLDMEQVGFWRFPLLDLSAGQASFVCAAEFADRILKAYRTYRIDGWAGRLEIDSATVRVVGERHAFMLGAGSRYRSNNTLIDSWQTGYLLERSGTAWRAAAITSPALLHEHEDYAVDWLTGLTVG